MRSIFFIAIFLILPSCGFEYLIVRHPDTIVKWYVDDYFDLDSKQSQQLGSDLNTLFRQFQCQNRDELVNDLKSFEEIIEKDWQEKETTWLDEELFIKWRMRLLLPFVPNAVSFLETVHEKQWQFLYDKFKERHTEKLEFLAEDPEDFLYEITEPRIENYENIYGSFSDDKLKKIKDWLKVSKAEYKTSRDRIFTIQKKFIADFRKLKTSNQRQEFLKNVITSFDYLREDKKAYKASVEKWWQVRRQIHNLTNKEQRKRYRRKTADMREAISGLEIEEKKCRQEFSKRMNLD